jgi:hypothetical protein
MEKQSYIEYGFGYFREITLDINGNVRHNPSSNDASVL